MIEDDIETTPEAKTPAQWLSLIRRKGTVAALKALTVGQIYAIATTIAALGAGTLAIIHNAQPDDVVSCADASGYPAGDWMVSGRALEYDHKAYPEGPPALGDVITFDSATVGHWRSDEPGTIGGTIAVSPPLGPGVRRAHMVATDKNSSQGRKVYESQADLDIDADGCRMHTELWTDNYNEVYPGQSRQSGIAKYFWMGRSSYWVKRSESPPKVLH